MRQRIPMPRPAGNDPGAARQKASKFCWLTGMDEDRGQH
jgi:hypothetical protein